MSEQGKELRFEGIVHASRRPPGGLGAMFVGVIVEGSDGRQWVVDYDEQSPFHAFADRRVLVLGACYQPDANASIMVRNAEGRVEHLAVSLMRPLEPTPDSELIEIGARHNLTGHFERAANDVGETTLRFVTEEGDAFLVANDPAGTTVGCRIDVGAYPVQLSPSSGRTVGNYLWMICGCSATDLDEWRARRS